MEFYLYILKVLNFAGTKFLDFREFWLFSQNFVPVKPKNREIEYLPILIILFFLIFDQGMILIVVYRISLLIVTKLESL